MNLLDSIFDKISVFFPLKRSLGGCGKNSKIQGPCYITTPKKIFLEENVIVRHSSTILNNTNERISIGKYTVISTNCTIVTNNHISTVGIPQSLLGISHINDISRNLTIGEDVFIGTNVTIMPNGNIGRGCVVGAGSIVTKTLPPYAVAVGSPAKIIAVKFNIEQILKHEETLYPPGERMNRNCLEQLFEMYYKGLKSYGVETEFSESDKERFLLAREKRHFIDPKHNKIMI